MAEAMIHLIQTIVAWAIAIVAATWFAHHIVQAIRGKGRGEP
jgi:hypothetical protein